MQKAGTHLSKKTLLKDRAELVAAFLSLKSADELGRFLQDLCTPAEIRALAERWHVACLLDGGQMSYRDIRTATGVSLATIGRVARFLTQEPHKGYAAALKKRQKKPLK